MDKISESYDLIVDEGITYHESQEPLEGRKKRVGHNLLVRMRDFKDAILRFLTDSDVPFTNNQAEQDIRMMKVKQKISGGFRTTKSAQVFANIRSFISSARKNGNNTFLQIQEHT